MTFAIHINRNFQVELKADTEIERQVLQEMADRAAKGVPVQLQCDQTSFTVTVQR